MGVSDGVNTGASTPSSGGETEQQPGHVGIFLQGYYQSTHLDVQRDCLKELTLYMDMSYLVISKGLAQAACGNGCNNLKDFQMLKKEELNDNEIWGLILNS